MKVLDLDSRSWLNWRALIDSLSFPNLDFFGLASFLGLGDFLGLDLDLLADFD